MENLQDTDQFALDHKKAELFRSALLIDSVPLVQLSQLIKLRNRAALMGAENIRLIEKLNNDIRLLLGL